MDGRFNVTFLKASNTDKECNEPIKVHLWHWAKHCTEKAGSSQPNNCLITSTKMSSVSLTFSACCFGITYYFQSKTVLHTCGDN